jgi:hypothetical protein
MKSTFGKWLVCGLIPGFCWLSVSLLALWVFSISALNLSRSADEAYSSNDTDRIQFSEQFVASRLPLVVFGISVSVLGVTASFFWFAQKVKVAAILTFLSIVGGMLIAFIIWKFR